MAGSRRKQTRSRKQFHSYYDYSLLFLTIFLVAFGLVIIYSTSSYMAQVNYHDSMHYLKQQGMASGLGIILMIIMSKIDYHIFINRFLNLPIKPIIVMYFLSLGMQIYVLIAGKTINGAKRWIKIGNIISFQPSEFAKVVIILVVSYLIYLVPRQLDHMSGFIRVGIYIAPILVLIAKENLSTAIVIAGIYFVTCFVASRKKLYFIFMGLLVVAAGAVYVFGGWRSTRIEIWQNLETHEKGFQILQGLYAIASGKIFGVGLGESMQKLGFIPEAQNDMIFTIICEELGLFGAISVVVLFLLLIWRLFILALSAPDLFGSLICVGILTHISIQVIINIAVVTNSIPSTGIPLPFISYGGTSVTFLLFEMGIALSVSNQIGKT